MNKSVYFLLGACCVFAMLCGCNSDDKDDVFPDLMTQMVDCRTDAEGTMKTMILDDDTELTIVNQQTGLKPDVIYRCLADYTVEDGKATLYGLKSCPFLRDSTSIGQCDPVNVVSLWRTPRYLNLHLMPKGQEFQHQWGYITDSIVGHHAYLRLHHRQGQDPLSYSADLYASLYLKELPESDTITLRIQTFSGLKAWTLTK